jgi:enamine deaminase RidA (YjgF/YER057c/UK114 family)
MAKPTAGYSQVAVVTGGNLVYIAGQVALDPSGNFVGKDDFRAQVEQVFKNLKAAIEAARGNFHEIIKLNFYCVDRSTRHRSRWSGKSATSMSTLEIHPPARSWLFAGWFVRSG